MKSSNYVAAIYLAFILTLAYSCTDEPDTTPEVLLDGLSTYEIIQTEIWDKNCTSCHQAGTSQAKQSDLILTADVSYAELTTKDPFNAAARSDELQRVGTKGLQSLYTSFLWEKINYPDYAHYYDDHPGYGALMPQGGRSLTNGELRFISQWIIGGAPETGQVVDPILLEDTERFEIPTGDFERLDPPSSGHQLNLGPFDVDPQSEREFLYFTTIDNEEDIYVNRVQIGMREGSHHMILYDYPQGDRPNEGSYRDYYNKDGSPNLLTILSIFNQRFVFGTQLRDSDYQFPEGVALRIPANAGFDLNSHYVNRTDETHIGEVSINLHTIPKSQVNKVAQNLFESYQDIFLPAQQVTTEERVSTFEERIHVFQLTSHAHEHMMTYEIFIEGGDRDGELVYFTNDWEHPPLVTFDPPITLEPGQGLRSRATYDNDTDKTLRFGLLSQDEMMILFGAYYTD